MTHAAGQAEPTDSPILHAAIAMSPRIHEAGEEIEQGRRIPPSIAEAMKDAGIFGMAMPRAWSGPELDPLMQFRAIEALAMADGSVGWCAMINSDGGYITAFLDQDVGRTMYPDIFVGTAGGATPTGKARRVPGGYRVSGRFPVTSGSQHCEWIWLGCVVTDDRMSRVAGNGVPETRQCFLKLSQCKILDTWHTTGLRGTGSNDILVDDMFVEAERWQCKHITPAISAVRHAILLGIADPSTEDSCPPRLLAVAPNAPPLEVSVVAAVPLLEMVAQ